VRQAGGEAVQPSAELKILNKSTSAEFVKKDMFFKAFGEMEPLISSLQDIRFLSRSTPRMEVWASFLLGHVPPQIPELGVFLDEGPQFSVVEDVGRDAREILRFSMEGHGSFEILHPRVITDRLNPNITCL